MSLSGSRRRPAAVVLVVLALGAAVLVAVAAREGDETPQDRATSTTRAPNGDAGPTVPEADLRLERNPEAVSVADHGADGRDDGEDDTAAFRAAIDAAVRADYRRPGGPGGAPQAVVYVPPGTYRILRLTFADHVRLEVDAGAALLQAGGVEPRGKRSKVLVVWDGESNTKPLRNVSIVGVGRADHPAKREAGDVEPGWDIASSFTMNLDPEATEGSRKSGGIEMLHVDGFLVQNLYSIQNATMHDPDVVAATKGGYPWPTSSKAVIVLRPRNDSPMTAPFAGPRNGSIVNHYNVDSPRGYGPNQIGSADNVRISRVYSRGGTALRLESDSTKNKDFGGEIRGLRADTIVGVECNRAVSFAPHAQKNRDVDVRGVVARHCAHGVIESLAENLGPKRRGAFTDSSISDVTVIGGPGAQIPARSGGGSLGAWKLGTSVQAVARDQAATWQVAYTEIRCRGSFSEPPAEILVDGRMQAPTCS